MGKESGELFQGTLGLMILKGLSNQEMHGYGIGRWIRGTTQNVLEIPEGSLYPALRRLEDRGFVTSRWDITDTGRRAKFYAITDAGRDQLRSEASTWLSFAQAVMLVLVAEPSLA